MKTTNLLVGLALLLCISFSAHFTPHTKHETDIFSKWLAWQQIYNDRNIAELSTTLNDTFLKNFKFSYQRNAFSLRTLTPLLSIITNGGINADGMSLQTPINEAMHANMASLYECIEYNMPAFIEILAQAGIMSDEINNEEQKNHFDYVIEKYKAFGRLLMVQDDIFKENEYLLAFANRLFEYAYSDVTFDHYQTILKNYAFHPIARFINASIWYQFVGEGWKHWHANPLDILTQDAQQNKEIVYLAGGTDFYHFLRQGIYNITIVDPFLPTQARYYSEGWEFLLSPEALGSEIRFGPSCKSIKMKCSSFEPGDTFYSKLSNEHIVALKKDTIIWDVFDRNNEQCGQVKILRRPVVQEDFNYNENKEIAMSYDEMVYVALPDLLNGWGIDVSLFDNRLQIHVKQLRKPVTKEQLCNIRIASLLNLSDLRFINLASDPT